MGSQVFTCPKCQNKLPSAIFIPGTEKIFCQSCNFKDTILEAVKLLEHDKKDWTMAQISEYLEKEHNVVFPKFDDNFYLDSYEKFGWDLVPCHKGTKKPYEVKDWPSIEHKNKKEWKDWLANNMNIGVKCGSMSGITVIDLDSKEIPDELKNISTLIQTTNRGYHYIFKYDEELPNFKFDINGCHIDVLNNGKQFIVFPSKVEGIKREWNFKHNEFTIPKMPDAIKKWLLDNSKPKKENILNNTNSNEPISLVKTSGNIKKLAEGGRSDTLIKFGGVLRKKLNIEQTSYALNLINNHFVDPPLPFKELVSLVGSIDDYCQFDEKELSDKILAYLQYAEEGTARDIAYALKEDKIKIDKSLAFLVQEQLLVRKRNMFSLLKKITWKDDLNDFDLPVAFKMPYFHDLARFNHQEIVLLGGVTGTGKTLISMNMVKRFVDQGVKIDYLCSEAGSRFKKHAKILGISEKTFRYSIQTDPLKFELEKNAITIIDWLHIEDFTLTETIFKYLSEQLIKNNGFLIVFMQLKKNGEWFAPNLVDTYSTLSARYLYEKDENGETDGLSGYWKVDKIREPIRHTKGGKIPCRYFPDTKLLLRIDECPNINPPPKTENDNKDSFLLGD
jgi:hypothetical protein